MDPTIKDFEAAIAELEGIVKKLEEGDLALETSLELYERGVQLSRLPLAPRRGRAAHRDCERTRRAQARAGVAAVAGRRRRVVSFAEWLEARRREVDSALEKFLSRPPGTPGVIADAMRYSLLGGGKRCVPCW